MSVELEFLLCPPSGELSLGQTDSAAEGQVSFTWRENSLVRAGNQEPGGSFKY